MTHHFLEHSPRGGEKAAQIVARDKTPAGQQHILVSVAWLSFPVSTALTLVLIDWQDTGVAKLLWAFVLPAVSGIVGGIAGLRAQKELLGGSAAAFGILAVPVAIHVVVLLYGP